MRLNTLTKRARGFMLGFIYYIFTYLLSFFFWNSELMLGHV